MGIVTDVLINKIKAQINAHHIVLWFDPEHHYGKVAESLSIPGTNVINFNPKQGLLSLRRELEPLWSQVEPPQLVVYLPISEKDTHHALIEFIVAGAIMQPGQQPPDRNTRLALIARQALEDILPSTNLDKVVTEVENSQLTLSELDEIAEHFKEVHVGALAIIFKTENTEEITLFFLTNSVFDQDIVTKNARTTMIDLLTNDLEIQLDDNYDLSKIRTALVRYLLFTDFIVSLGKAIPPNLTTVPLPKTRVASDTVLRIVRNWRLRSDLAQDYIQAAQRIEPELGLQNQTWNLKSLEDTETFGEIEVILQKLVEEALIEKPSPELVAFAQKRSVGFWPNQNPAQKLRWNLIIGAGDVILKSKQILSLLKPDHSAFSMVKNYIGPENAWCLLDTTYRRMERDEHQFDFEGQVHDSLHKLLAEARINYADILHVMADGFIHAYERSGFILPELIQQMSIFHDFVLPTFEEGRTAYFLIDSFRYEMALELFQQIKTNLDCQLLPALATPPTITEVGMAALMPGAEKGITLISAGGGKLCVQVLKSILKVRADRVKHLKESSDPSIEVLELTQIAPLKDKKLNNSLKDARFVVITATDEIDGLWENQPEMARRLQDDVFIQLRRGIHSLIGLGFAKIIITSDHGFISGDNLITGTPIDPPGGETIDLHRRVWVGKGGSVIESCLRKPIAAFGLSGDLDLVTPYGLGCFKVAGGSTQYFHGGLSLQEMVIPILVVSAGKAGFAPKESNFLWGVTLGSKQISTRFFSVTISGDAKEMFSKPSRIRAELRSGNQVISTPVSASYGFDEITKDVLMRFETEGSLNLESNTITLYISEVPSISQVDLHILNSETGLSLYQVTGIPIAISF